MSYKTNQIGLNIPAKVLTVNVSSITGTERWPHDDGEGDRWWSGGTSPKFYRWRMVMSVAAKNHGSHLTRDDFQYNGLDISSGDWIAAANSGLALKIISVENKTKNSVTCVVEDWLRYNTFRSQTGTGVFDTGTAVVFTINEYGLPMIDPLPAGVVSVDFYSNVISRFQYLNPRSNYVLEQTNHGFAENDSICVDRSGNFVKANSQVLSKFVGIVTHAGPGPDQFMIQTSNKIVDFKPAIPGNAGDFVYADIDGGLTTTNTGKIVFLKLKDAVPTEIAGTVQSPEVPDGVRITLNGELVDFEGSGSNLNVSQVAEQINSVSANTLVSAFVDPWPTVVTSEASGTAYGIVGGYPEFSAFFDTGSGNTEITFNTTAAGEAQYGVAVAIASDLAADINAANIPNLTAEGTATTLTLTEANGNAITITNGDADANSFTFVGSSNISGLPGTTSASGGTKLRLLRSDGGEILIYEDINAFQTHTGIFSTHNGNYPLALNIEQGIRSATSTVVVDLAARDNLVPGLGDQAYVLDTGEGEWALYLWDSEDWVIVATQDSASTSAKTVTYEWTMPGDDQFSVETKTLGRLSPGSKVISVTAAVTTEFTGFTETPELVVGTQSNIRQFMTEDSNDLESMGNYVSNPEYTYPETNSTELEIRARLDYNGATSGTVKVTVSYV